MLQVQPPVQYDALQLARDVAAGLAHIHALGTTHGNLNSQQIFLDQARQHAKILDKSSSVPEPLLRWHSLERMDNQGKFHPATKQSDVYSLGLMLWCLVSRQQPFPLLMTEPELVPIRQWSGGVQMAHKFTKDGPYSREIVEVIRQCWEAPHMRPSAQTIFGCLSDPDGMVPPQNCAFDLE